jgi:peptidyl-prolyl cis-trans isomerase D
LDEVRDEIIEALRFERAREKALQAAEALAEQVRRGVAWSEAMPDAVVEAPGAVDRNNPDIPGPVRDVAFTLPVPREGETSVGTATSPEGDIAVVQVLAVADGEVSPAEDSSPMSEASALAQLLGRQAYEAMLGDMERRAKVERRAIRAQADL